jgi:hypothetical protein
MVNAVSSSSRCLGGKSFLVRLRLFIGWTVARLAKMEPLGWFHWRQFGKNPNGFQSLRQARVMQPRWGWDYFGDDGHPG